MKLNFFKTKDLHFIYLKISSLQPKTEKFQPITKSTKASVILPNFKPITVGTIFCPPYQSNVLEVPNE